MKIQSNLSHSANPYGQIKRQQQASSRQVTTAKFSESIAAETSPRTTSTERLDIGKAEGVIRNLQEGHYKGVAQLRLSIVHAERFQQAASQATAEVFESEGEQLTAAVREKMASLFSASENTGNLESGTGAGASLDLDGALKAFEEAVITGKEGLESGSLTIQAFTDLYSAAFQALTEKLNPVDAQSVNEFAKSLQSVVSEEVEGEGITDGLVEAGSVQSAQAANVDTEQDQGGVDAGVSALNAWFAEALKNSVDAIQNQVDTLSTPPLTGKPEGRGAAYENFLAIYEGIYGKTETQADNTASAENGSIDTDA